MAVPAHRHGHLRRLAAERALRVSMLDGERAVRRVAARSCGATLAGGRVCAASRRRCERNFQTLNATVERVARHQFASGAAARPRARSGLTTRSLAALDRAAKSYESQTSTRRARRDGRRRRRGGAAAGWIRVLLPARIQGARRLRGPRRRVAAQRGAPRAGPAAGAAWAAGSGTPTAHVISYSAEHARLHGWTDREPPRRPGRRARARRPPTTVRRVAKALRIGREDRQSDRVRVPGARGLRRPADPSPGHERHRRRSDAAV